ncbi:SLC30A1 [Cordylochernes scorpioides]|uniref:SLC30A1 n=1 Tax=Cordylochernes scorpioides TaxID=51811 RepID=A0ABY6LC32_9ARAC|nr:SLC30A1 [Cordylochernes scorpioides]
MGRYTGKRCRLISMLILTSLFFFIEIVVGYLTNSMALVADSFHMLSDVISLIIAFISVRISPMKWSQNTFGWARAEILGALVNAVFLIALCFSILVEAIKRFFTPEEITQPALILYVGAAGLVVNLIGLGLFRDQGGHGHSHGGGATAGSKKVVTSEMSLNSQQDINENQIVPPVPNKEKKVKKPRRPPSPHQLGRGMSLVADSSSQMNMRGVFLHVLTDALGSVIVLVSALIIWKTDWAFKLYVDPTLSFIMVCLIIYSTWPLFSVDESGSPLSILNGKCHKTYFCVYSCGILHDPASDGAHAHRGGSPQAETPAEREYHHSQARTDTDTARGVQVQGVLGVHEFHVWQLAGEKIIASAHICCRDMADYMALASRIKEFFHNEGIHSTTIQPEFIGPLPNSHGSKVTNCFLDCPTKDFCLSQTCCGRAARAAMEGQVNLVVVEQPPG